MGRVYLLFLFPYLWADKIMTEQPKEEYQQNCNEHGHTGNQGWNKAEIYMVYLYVYKQ